MTQTDVREYPAHGHWLYSEPGWETPARDILEKAGLLTPGETH